MKVPGNFLQREAMITLVQGQLDAYNARDIDAFCKFFHPEVVCSLLNPATELIRGLEKFRTTYAKMFAEHPQLHCELKSRTILETIVIDEEWVTGRGPEGTHVCAIYAFRDGLIDRVWFAK